MSVLCRGSETHKPQCDLIDCGLLELGQKMCPPLSRRRRQALARPDVAGMTTLLLAAADVDDGENERAAALAARRPLAGGGEVRRIDGAGGGLAAVRVPPRWLAATSWSALQSSQVAHRESACVV